MKDSLEVGLSIPWQDLTSSLQSETNADASGEQTRSGTSTPPSITTYPQTKEAYKNLVSDPAVPTAVRLAQDVPDSSKISSSNPPEQNPLQLTNLAALDIWKSYIQEGEKSDNDAAQGYWNQFKEAIETSFSGRGRTERDDSTRGWANERALVSEVEKILKDGTALTIHSALYLIEKGMVPLPEKGVAHIRERARAYLGYDGHTDPGLITRLIRYTREAAPDSDHAKALLDETFANLEAKDSAVQTAFAIYSLVNQLSPEAEIQQATQGHLNALQGHSSFKRAAEKFLYSLSPTEVAVNVGLMFVSGGLGNLAKLLAMKKFEQAGVMGLKAIAGATGAGFATETASLGTFNNLQQVLTHDHSKMTAKDIADNYKKAASMIGFTKLFGNIGGIAAPNFAKGLGLATQEGLTLGGKALSWGVGHTAGLSGMIASSRFNQARGWQQAPVGGENESLMNDLLGYVEFAGAQGLAHSAVDALTQGTLSAFQQRQQQEIFERGAKLISQIPGRLSPAMAAMTAGASILLAPELAQAAVHATEASAEGSSRGLFAGLGMLTTGLMAFGLGMIGGKGKVAYQLRDYQEEASQNTLTAIQLGKGNGLIVLPTGTGKTVTFAEIAKRIAEQGLLGSNKKTLVLVHRVELVDQAKKAFERILGKGSVSLVSAGRESREFGGRVVVAGVQTLVTEEMLKNLKSEEYGLVIVDETHHIVANTYRKILEHLGLIDENAFGKRVEGKFLLGVTATPDRSDGIHISVTFNDGLLFSKPILWFVNRDYLLRPHGVLVTTGARLSNVKVGASGDYIESELGAEMSKEKVLKEIVQAYDDCIPGQRSLVFAASVGHAQALAQEFNQGLEKPRAEYIDGSLDPDTRQDRIDRHKRGELDILVNYGVLTEGYDDPGIEAIMVARPTRSRALYTQMIGRGLRPDPDHPERRQATIIDITGGILDHQLDMDLAKLFGVDYVEAGLPPTDVVKVSEEFGNVLKNPEILEKIRKSGIDDQSSELQYVGIAMIHEASRPLPALLRKILSLKYGDDFSKMAWQLGMTEGRLTDYISGIFPSRSDTVAKDFANAQSALGISRDEILELWRQSQLEANLSLITAIARRLSLGRPGYPLEDFFPKFASDWIREALVSREPKDPSAMLAQRLWEWNRLGVDVREIEEILERHDTSIYKRSQAKVDLQTLTDMARRHSFGGEELIREARERGQVTIPAELSLEGFLKRCQYKGLYTQELNTVLNRNRINRRGISDYGLFFKTMEEFVAADPTDRGELSQHYQQKMNIPPQDLPILLIRFLSSRIPEASRVKMLQMLEAIGILGDLPFAGSLERLDGFAALSRSPEQHLAQLFRKSGLVSPEYLAKRLLPVYLHQQTIPGRLGKSFTKLRGVLGPSQSERESDLKPGAFSFPRLESEAMQRWVAQRFGTTPELWKEWSEMGKKYDINLYRYVDEWWVKESLIDRLAMLADRVRDEAREQETKLYYEDFVKRIGELTGLDAQGIEEWFHYTRIREKGAGSLPETTKKIFIPINRPSSQGEIWLQEVRKGQNRWSRIDGPRDKQKKIQQAVQAAGMDWNLVLKTVASWDPATVKGAEQGLITILFDKAGFKRPKPSGKS